MGNVVPMDSKLLSNYWYMSWPSWPAHISKLCSHKNQGCSFKWNLHEAAQGQGPSAERLEYQSTGSFCGKT